MVAHPIHMHELLVVLPILIIELLLLVVALIDLGKAKRTRGPKWVWVIVIIIFSILGPIAYFLFGKDNR